MTASLFALLLFAQTPTPLPVLDYFDPPAPGAPQPLRSTNPLGQPKYVSPAHATLLPSGDVLLIGVAHDAIDGTEGDMSFVGRFTPPPAWVTLQPEQTVTWESAAVEETGTWYWDDPTTQPEPRWYVQDFTFCTGQTLLADGRLFTAGGTQLTIDRYEPNGLVFWLLGLEYSMIRDDFGTWRRVTARMGQRGEFFEEPKRWYPTATRTHEGKIMVTGGSDLIMIQDAAGNIPAIPGTNPPRHLYLMQNRSVELFDPATETWSPVSTHAQAPEAIWNPDYTHVFHLPSTLGAAQYDTLMFGDDGVPVLLSPTQPEGSRWLVRTDAPRPRLPEDGTAPPNDCASSCPLPYRADANPPYANGTVLVTGGLHGTSHEHSIDLYDPVANTWSRRDMLVHRHIPLTTVLPDGRVLIAAGVGCGCSTGDAGNVTYLDTKAPGMPLQMGLSEMPETRGYHAVSLLLPDGRVLIAGGRRGDKNHPADEQPTLRYLYPSYLFTDDAQFDSLRPHVWLAPETIRRDEPFNAIWGGREATEAVLIGLGAMTHAFDANQRSVPLVIDGKQQVQPNEWVGAFRLAADARHAPAGHYMLFLVDAQRKIGTAKIVRLE